MLKYGVRLLFVGTSKFSGGIPGGLHGFEEGSNMER